MVLGDCYLVEWFDVNCYRENDLEQTNLTLIDFA